MIWHNKENGFDHIDTLSKQRTPFLFVISFDTKKIFAQPLNDLDGDIYYKLEDWRNYPVEKCTKPFTFSKFPVDFNTYKKALDEVLEEIRSGNTYLLNLTFKTPIESNFTLQEIFTYARAKFKLYFKDEFICFSPERFVEIENNTIATYPMKGTINAHLPDAKESILADKKEMAEHVMIVDLMRNDLGIIGSDIKVEKFRYVEKIKAGEKELLQVVPRSQPHFLLIGKRTSEHCFVKYSPLALSQEPPKRVRSISSTVWKILIEAFIPVSLVCLMGSPYVQV